MLTNNTCFLFQPLAKKINLENESISSDVARKKEEFKVRYLFITLCACIEEIPTKCHLNNFLLLPMQGHCLVYVTYYELENIIFINSYLGHIFHLFSNKSKFLSQHCVICVNRFQ